MNSLKGIVSGALFVLFVMICLQLVFVFIAVGYHNLANDFPLLDKIAIVFRYLVGIPILLAVLFVGGYITEGFANSKSFIGVCLHCSVIAFLSIGGMTFSALEYASLSMTGIIVMVLAVIGSFAGGCYRLQKTKNKSVENLKNTPK